MAGDHQGSEEEEALMEGGSGMIQNKTQESRPV